MLYNRNDVFIGKSIEMYGEFSEGEVELFAQFCAAGGVVIEVGANIGAHTLPLAKLVGAAGRVYAFEPQRVVYQTLCANVAINSLTNVECFHCAVGAQPGHVLIPEIDYSQPANFGGLSVNQFEQGSKVPLVSLDGFIDPPHVHLLKVDVEGMEQEVLQGAKGLIERFRPVLYVENDRKDRSRELIELIRSMGYKLYWHTPPLFSPDNFAGEPKNLWPNVVSVNLLCVHEALDANITGFDEVTDTDIHPTDGPKE